MDSLKDRKGLQKDLDKLESWVITSLMEFSKSKSRILHLEKGNPGHMYKSGDKRQESSPVDRDLGVGAGGFGLVGLCWWQVV